MKRQKISPTKGQFRELNSCHIGFGVLMIHTSDNEVTTIEVYTDKDGVLRRVGNGEPVLPIRCYDSNGEFTIQRANF